MEEKPKVGRPIENPDSEKHRYWRASQRRYRARRKLREAQELSPVSNEKE